MTEETINIPLELECGDVVNISIGISLTCNCGEDVSVTPAILAAIAASSGEAFFLPTDTSANLGGVSDGGAVTAMTTAQGINPVATNAVWNEGKGGIDFSGTASGISVPIDTGFSSDAAVFMVVETTDDVAIMLSSAAVNSDFAFIFQDGSSSTVTSSDDPYEVGANIRLFVDGVDASSDTRDQLHTKVATGSKVVISIRNAQLSVYSGTFNLGQRNGDFNLDGIMADIVVVDDPGDEDAALIEAELAARHGITIP